MKTLKSIILVVLLIPVSILFIQCEKDDILPEEKDIVFQKRARPTTEVGNNLSFPVIWSEGSIGIPGTQGTVTRQGVWWYVWGPDPVDPRSPIYSCEPDLEMEGYCDSGDPAGDNGPLWKAWVQKDVGNSWQAENTFASSFPVQVSTIDWGDNLESVSWNTKSQIRTEVVLYKNVSSSPMLEYTMKHVEGWGSSEVHGLAENAETGDVVLGPGEVATVYSSNAKLTIQKLLVPKTQIAEGDLEWIDGAWTETDETDNLINDPILNTNYSAECNVKGKIIYGYTWNVRKNNEGGGDYRITFSLTNPDKTSISQAEIATIDDEEEVTLQTLAVASSPSQGGEAVLVRDKNLTYIDITIVQNNKGKKVGRYPRR